MQLKVVSLQKKQKTTKFKLGHLEGPQLTVQSRNEEAKYVSVRFSYTTEKKKTLKHFKVNPVFLMFCSVFFCLFVFVFTRHLVRALLIRW